LDQLTQSEDIFTDPTCEIIRGQRKVLHGATIAKSRRDYVRQMIESQIKHLNEGRVRAKPHGQRPTERILRNVEKAEGGQIGAFGDRSREFIVAEIENLQIREVEQGFRECALEEVVREIEESQLV